MRGRARGRPGCGTRGRAMDEAEELIIEQIEIGPMKNFTYLVGSARTREVALVDPAWAVDALLDHVGERGLPQEVAGTILWGKGGFRGGVYSGKPSGAWCQKDRGCLAEPDDCRGIAGGSCYSPAFPVDR